MSYQKSFMRAQQMYDVPKTSSRIVKSDPPPPQKQYKKIVIIGEDTIWTCGLVYL